MKRLAKLTVCAAALLVAGCSSPPERLAGPQTPLSQASFAPSPGAARVYILPTHSQGLFSDADGRARISIFPADKERGVTLGSTTANRFLAFDIAPGSYDLVAHGSDPFSKVEQPLDVAAGKTYFLRPVFFRTANDLREHGATGMGFDPIPADQAEAEANHFTMAPLTEKGATFLRQTMTPPQPVAQPAPSTMAQPAPMMMAQPAPMMMAQPAPSTVAQPAFVAPQPQAAPVPPAASSGTLEEKLRVLQRLYREGLISKSDLDAKRKALLDAF